MSAFVVTLQGGAPWGLRLQGGSGTGKPLRIAKINPGSKAARAQLHVGDLVVTVNGVQTTELPLTQAQKLLHNNTNDLQLRIYRNQLSVNGSLHPNGQMSAQSNFVVTNDSGFSGTGSPTSPPLSPTNGYPMTSAQQKDEPPPPIADIPTNNNYQWKDTDEFWPPPPPPDESVRSPSKGSTSVDHSLPPNSGKDGVITAPVWTPSGGQTSTKEFKPVKPDLTSKPRTSATKPTYSAPPAESHSWVPPSRNPTGPHESAPPPSPYDQPITVDTIPDPSHILSPSYVSPRSASLQQQQPVQLVQPVPLRSTQSQDQYTPQPPPQPGTLYSPVGRVGPTSPGAQPVPASRVRSGPGPGSGSGPVSFEGVPNGYGFIPASAVMSGSPGALSSDPSQLPPGALFQKQTIEGDVVHTDTFYPVQNVTKNTSTVTKHEAPSYTGIGPRDKDGLPLGLRQHVKEDNRRDWYKEMFKSIHKQDKDDEMTRPCYESRHRYPHEIENETRDAWKSVSENRDSEPERVVKNTPTYRVQPGRITDFVPGKSALAAHEKTIQAQKDVPVMQGRRLSAPGSGYASDEDARKAYRNFVKSGELPSQGLGLGAPPARRENKPSTTGPAQSSIQSPSHQLLPPPPPLSSSSPPKPSSPSLHGAPSPRVSWSGGGSTVPVATALKSASLPRSSLPKKKQRYSEGGGLTAAERLGIKSPPPARLSASSATAKPTVPDSRYDYMNKLTTSDRSNDERKQREIREPDASYNKSLPEYNPIKGPAITDDRFDDFDFTPPIVVPAAKQEVLPKVERTLSVDKKITRASAIALYPFTAQNKKELSFKKGDAIFLTREVDKNWFEGEHHGSKGIFPRSYVEVVTSIEEARSLQVNAPSADGKGRARYKFKGETANELSVNKGEIIDLVRRIDANWWEARAGERAGIVPVAYLEVLREPQQGQGGAPSQLSPGGPTRAPVSPSGGRSPLGPSPLSKSPSYQTQSSSPLTRGPSSPAPAGHHHHQQQLHHHQQQQQPGGHGVQPGRRDNVGRPAQSAGLHQGHPQPPRQFGSPTQERYCAVYSYQPNNDDELELMEGDTVVVMEKCDDGWFVGFSESTGMFGTFPGNYVDRL